MMHLLLKSAADQVDYEFVAYTVGGEGLSSEVDDLITYLIVTCDDKTSVAADKRVTHRKGLHATVTFIMEVRDHIKIAKFRCGKYCTGYCSTPYAQPGTRVFGTEEYTFLKGALVADYFLEFCVIHDIPIFFPVPPLPFNLPNVISG